jgi:hypothetical protein
MSLKESCAQAYQVVHQLRRELYNYPHHDLPELLTCAEALAKQLGPYPDTLSENENDIVLCGKIPLQDQEVKTIATVLRFDKPVDVTVAELRIELIFPADDPSAEFFKQNKLRADKLQPHP